MFAYNNNKVTFLEKNCRKKRFCILQVWIWRKSLSSWVNFTNILRTAFLYKSFTQSLFVLEVKVKLFIGAKKIAQLHSKNVGEIDSLTVSKRRDELKTMFFSHTQFQWDDKNGIDRAFTLDFKKVKEIHKRKKEILEPIQ